MQQPLRLPLKYFLPLSDLHPPEAGEQEIIIPFEKLAQYLEEAEAQEQLVRAEQGISKIMPVGMRKRRRESTPPETLDSADERRFEWDELMVEKLADEQEKDWKEI